MHQRAKQFISVAANNRLMGRYAMELIKAYERKLACARIVLGRPILEGTTYSLALIDLLALVRFVLVLGV